MPRRRFPPDDPREWINRAASCLKKAARMLGHEDIYPEDVCFDCQQCVEKAMKGVLIQRQGRFPKTHSIVQLASLVQTTGIKLPDTVQEAAGLTEYAHGLRYPGWSEAASDADASEAIRLAKAVLKWARLTVQAGRRVKMKRTGAQ